jgi:hypothetical protein
MLLYFGILKSLILLEAASSMKFSSNEISIKERFFLFLSLFKRSESSGFSLVRDNKSGKVHFGATFVFNSKRKR